MQTYMRLNYSPVSQLFVFIAFHATGCGELRPHGISRVCACAVAVFLSVSVAKLFCVVLHYIIIRSLPYLQVCRTLSTIPYYILLASQLLCRRMLWVGFWWGATGPILREVQGILQFCEKLTSCQRSMHCENACSPHLRYISYSHLPGWPRPNLSSPNGS